MRRLALVAALTLAATLLFAAPAPAPILSGVSGNAFYTPPKPTPGKVHGDAIWMRKVEGEPVLSEARINQLMLYRSTSVAGKTVAVSGIVHLPKGNAPKGGWPVISWAHATSGLGDQCAPSRDTGAGAVHLYHVYIEGLLDRWLKAGYAVVRTDYEGLGTKGVHPYLVGVSEGRGVLDMVRAARQAYKSIGPRVVFAGHSQGGHAALFAAALAPKWAPELIVRGTATFAPASQNDDALTQIETATQPSRATGYLAAAARGLDAAYPKLGIAKLLSDRGKQLYPQTLSLCIPEIVSEDSEFAKVAPADFFVDGADLAAVAKVAAASDPTGLRIRTPVLVAQGTADTTVPPAATDALVAGLRKRGAKVTYRMYDVDHTFVVFNAPADDATAFIAKRLK